MAATKLGVYNETLRLLGERTLASLSENREARRLLDAAWDSNSNDSWLEQADWNFALRSVRIAADSSFTQTWGYQHRFDQPLDMVRPAGIYTDEFMSFPLREYFDEGKYWFVNQYDIIYVQYVSNAASYGGDLGRWPSSFAKYVAAFLAVEVAPNLKNDVDAEALYRLLQRREKEARAKDGLRNPSRQLPRGSWSLARLAGNRGDGTGTKNIP